MKIVGKWKTMAALAGILFFIPWNSFANSRPIDTNMDCTALTDQQLADLSKDWTRDDFDKQRLFCAGQAEAYDLLSQKEKDTINFIDLQQREAASTRAVLKIWLAAAKKAGQ